MAERRIPTQAEYDAYYQRPENKPWATTSAVYSLLDAATLGYMPKLKAAITGGNETEIARDFEAQQRASTIGDWTGGIVGTVMPTGLAAKGAIWSLRGLNALKNAVAGSAALPAIAAKVGADVARTAPRLAVNPAGFVDEGSQVLLGRTLGNIAKKSAVPVAKGAGALSAGSGIMYVAGADRSANIDDVTAAVAANAANNASDAGTAAGAQPESGRRSVNEYWADRMGVRPEDVAAIRQQYGGIPLFFAQELGKTRPASPDYKDVLGSLIVRQLEASADAAEASGDQKQMNAVNEEIRRILNGDSL